MQRNLLAAQFDAATELKDAGSISASGAATVGGVARVVNIGTAFMRATLVIDVDLLDLTTGDETVELRLQGSTVPDFTSDVVILDTIRVGDTSVSAGETVDRVAGRYTKSVMNTVDGRKPYPYLRMYAVLAGTTPSISYRAFLTKDVLA
jgi:hypothetical protein